MDINAIKRYQEAIADLQVQLAKQEYTYIKNQEFQITHGISSCFLAVLTRAKILDRRNATKGVRGWEYKRTAKLVSLTAEVAIQLVNASIRNSSDKKHGEPEHGFKTIDPYAVYMEHHQTSNLPETMVEDNETYMVGIFKDGKITFNATEQITIDGDPTQANSLLRKFHLEPGEKIVLARLIQVYEAEVVYKPSTLFAQG